MKQELIQSKNVQLSEISKDLLVGGVNSPVRSFAKVDCEPLLIERGSGAHIFDYDGNSYIDYVLSFGANILGHADRCFQEALKSAVSSGASFGTTHKSEIELARLIASAVPSIEKMRFVSSGTEAVMGALRLARGVTGREKIVIFSNSYHGHADYLLNQGGSGLATQQIPFSQGVPQDFIKHTIVAEYANVSLINEIFSRFGSEIAAVIVEPVGGNYGVRYPDISFLKQLKSLTKKHNSMLVADEVITGFRFHFGSCMERFGIEPDIICLGKIIGGGLPVGAYGGRSSIMDALSPLGKVYQASTFGGHPLVMQAGSAVLGAIKERQSCYPQLEQFAGQIAASFKDQALHNGYDICVKQYESMFSIVFSDKRVFAKLYPHLLKNGVFIAPSEFEANFVSFRHAQADLDQSMQAIIEAFGAMRAGGSYG